ncbi:MAG: LppX_LprAFG lipoprotein [Solirubrobacterales bacterium]
MTTIVAPNERNGMKSARSGKRRWIGAGLAVVVLAIVAFVVAQGGGSGGGPLDAIAKAAEVTQREPGGRATIEAVVTVSNSPEGITETGSMIFDETGLARGTMTVKGDSNGKEAQLVVIADGARSYVSSDQFESLPEGKKWMELDFAAAAGKELSSSPTDGGPQEGLKVLEAVHDAEEVGKEDIGGVPTTHYTGTLPTSNEVFGVKVHYSAPQVEVWIDAKDRVRRMHVVVSGSVGEEEETSTTEMTMNFVSFGRVPKINLPNPEEVFDATSEVESNIRSAAEGN